MPDSESRHLDAETLLLSLGAVSRWTLEYLGKELAWENSQQQCQRLATVHTSQSHAMEYTEVWSLRRALLSPQTWPCPWCCRNTPVPSGRGHHCQHPSCSLPVLRTESVAGTTTNAQWASTASKSKFKHTDVNTRMNMKNQVKKQVDDP